MKQPILLLFLLTYMVSGDTLSCSDIKTTYNNKECCSNLSSDTCLRSLPACTDTSVVAGEICTDTNENAIMKDLTSLTRPKLLQPNDPAPNQDTPCEIGDMILQGQKLFICWNVAYSQLPPAGAWGYTYYWGFITLT